MNIYLMRIYLYIHLFATSPKSNLQILPQQQRVQNLEHVCACFRSVKKFTRNTRTNPSQYLSGTNVIRTEGIFEHADGRCSFDMRLYVTVKDGVDTKKTLVQCYQSPFDNIIKFSDWDMYAACFDRPLMLFNEFQFIDCLEIASASKTVLPAENVPPKKAVILRDFTWSNCSRWCWYFCGFPPSKREFFHRIHGTIVYLPTFGAFLMVD